MIFSKFEELKTLSILELDNELLNLRKEILNLKIQQATFRKIKPHLFKHIKHRISQIMFYKTKLENQKKL